MLVCFIRIMFKNKIVKSVGSLFTSIKLNSTGLFDSDTSISIVNIEYRVVTRNSEFYRAKSVYKRLTS